MKFLLTLLLLLLLALAAGAYIVYTPFGPTAETFVDIPPGTGATAIASPAAEKRHHPQPLRLRPPPPHA